MRKQTDELTHFYTSQNSHCSSKDLHILPFRSSERQQSHREKQAMEVGWKTTIASFTSTLPESPVSSLNSLTAASSTDSPSDIRPAGNSIVTLKEDAHAPATKDANGVVLVHRSPVYGHKTDLFFTAPSHGCNGKKNTREV